MASIQEIKEALKRDPSLLNRIPNLREFVEQNREHFQFLFTGSNGFQGEAKQKNKKDKPIESVSSKVDQIINEGAKWNPKITKI